jgi:rhodanese-related sulfurtransferase
MAAKGIYRDPVRSSHRHFVTARGLRWISLRWLTSSAWAQIIREIAARTGQKEDAVLSELIDQSVSEIPLSALPDREILAIADMMMAEHDQEELADLLDDQREGQLDATKRIRLDELMQVYCRGMVRKSEALKVAVQRGLHPAT